MSEQNKNNPGQYLYRQKEKENVKAKTKEKEKVKENPSDLVPCPHCGAVIKRSWEFCPQCGHALVDYCTFCGADVPTDAQECPECGMPRKGVPCPRCGTINARAYCRCCNEPLTIAAKKELERALKDPKFIRAAQAAIKAAELEAMIKQAMEEEVIEDVVPSGALSPEIQRLRELMGSIQQYTPAGGGGGGGGDDGDSWEERIAAMKAQYLSAKAELAAALEALAPPPGSTPQQQRDYYSARKVPTVTTKTVKSKDPCAWVCNFCGCWHNKPSECAEPWHGGTWIYDTRTVDFVTFD